MPSAVTICNLALTHLGDSATVASIDPPEGSAQAEHCARFYPVALDLLLEAHPWNFATRRAKPSLLAHEGSVWRYSYALPHDALSILALLPAGATDDYEALGVRVPVEYQLEQVDGTTVILTDLKDAELRYLSRAIDPDRYPAAFVEALAWKLAALLTGPLLKGEAGMKMGQRCEEMAAHYLMLARSQDSNRRLTRVEHVPAWIRAR